MQSKNFEYAGFWIRMWASVIDTLLIFVITCPVLFAVYGSDYWSSSVFIKGPIDFLISWVLPAIVIVIFWKKKQATPGKLAISAKIIDANTGKTATTSQLIIRYTGYFVSIIPFFLGILWIAFDPRKQGWHDKLANTVVVRKKTESTVTAQLNTEKIMIGVAGGILLAGIIGFLVKSWFTASVIQVQTAMFQESVNQIKQIPIFVPNKIPEQNSQLQIPSIRTLQPAIESEVIKKKNNIAIIEAKDETEVFKAQYKKPAECYDMKDSETRMKCANA
jgi:uncharacterized RDD family membrane protein YckC